MKPFTTDRIGSERYLPAEAFTPVDLSKRIDVFVVRYGDGDDDWGWLWVDTTGPYDPAHAELHFASLMMFADRSFNITQPIMIMDHVRAVSCPPWWRPGSQMAIEFRPPIMRRFIVDKNHRHLPDDGTRVIPFPSDRALHGRIEAQIQKKRLWMPAVLAFIVAVLGMFSGAVCLDVWG